MCSSFKNDQNLWPSTTLQTHKWVQNTFTGRLIFLFDWLGEVWQTQPHYFWRKLVPNFACDMQEKEVRVRQTHEVGKEMDLHHSSGFGCPELLKSMALENLDGHQVHTIHPSSSQENMVTGKLPPPDAPTLPQILPKSGLATGGDRNEHHFLCLYSSLEFGK